MSSDYAAIVRDRLIVDAAVNEVLNKHGIGRRTQPIWLRCCSETIANYAPISPVIGLEIGCANCPSALRFTANGWRIHRSPRVYVAAPFQLRETALTVRSGLQSVGLSCSSRWLDLESDTWDEAAALADLADVESSSMVLLINPRDWAVGGTGGRHVEVGYAVAKGRPIVLIGERTNVFHHHPSITVVPDFTSAINTAKEFVYAVGTVS